MLRGDLFSREYVSWRLGLASRPGRVGQGNLDLGTEHLGERKRPYIGVCVAKRSLPLEG